MPYIAIVPMLNASTLTAIRYAFRDKIREAGFDIKLSHVSEAVASALEYGSFAALRAALAEAGGTMSAKDFLTGGLISRVEELAAIPHEFPRLFDLHKAADQAVRKLSKGGVIDPYGRHVLPDIDWKQNGRMISASKSGYYREYPENTVVFNAHIMTEAEGLIWCGDLDVTRDLPQLQARSRELGVPLYIVREGAFWNGGKGPPQVSAAIGVVTPEDFLKRE